MTKPHLRSRVGVVLIVLLPWLGLGMLVVRVSGESARTQKAVQEAVQQEAARTDTKLRVDCGFYGLIAGAPLPSNANDLSRRIVRASEDSYDQRGCERVAGPLSTPTATPSR